jgi:uncharacterized protein
MGTEQVEMVKGVYDALGRGDIPAILGVLDPGIVWVESEAQNVPARGTHVGPDAIAGEVFASVPESWSEFALAPESFHDAGSTVIVTGRLRATAKGTGRSIDAPFANVVTVEDGKITRLVSYHDTALWLEALRG